MRSSELCVSGTFVVSDGRHCFLGDRCQFYSKSIGLTLDDILRYEVQQNITLLDHSPSAKISAAVVMIMFVAGLINSCLAFVTFQNREARKVGCGMYLLASSITSFLTICMFTIKFWFFLLVQTNASTSLSVLRAECVLIETTMKLFLYLDAWFNSCVAIERAVAVSSGVNFDKTRSKQLSCWIILFLPFGIMSSIIHEPLHRQLFHDREIQVFWCLTQYSSSIHYYNIIILFFHFLGPFAANLFSTLFIIFGTVHHRAMTRFGQRYSEQLRRQMREHKQLLISPIILVVLSLPRLIISLISGCVDVSRQQWLYLSGYFISFVPSMLVFVVFVLPSGLYKKQFQGSAIRWQQRMHRG